MTDAQQYDDDIVLPSEGFEVHARQNGECQYDGWVYIGTEIVFAFGGNTWDYPAGIEDFARVTLRTFTRRLAAILREPA